jgi:hypothetical protein
MANYIMIPAALLVTLVVTLLFSLFSKRPLSGLWLFFLLIFLATWTGQLWIPPFGPSAWGVSWVPLIVVAVFFTLLVVALTTDPVLRRPAGDDVPEQSVFLALGVFLWVVLIIFIIAIITGYYRSFMSAT